MRILIITENIGKTAPGIVFERLLQGLSVDNELSVITANYEPNIDLSKLKNVEVIKKSILHPRLFRLLYALFTICPNDWYWVKKAINKLNKIDDNNFVVVLSFASFHHYSGLIAGKMYAKKKRIKHAVYFVDAIPAPGAWSVNKQYDNAVLKLVNKYLSDVDAFFSSNEQMLAYQMKTFTPQKGMISGVIYAPTFLEFKNFSETNDNTNNFVYTGGIYGARKADYILDGFKSLLKKHPDSKLQFIGGSPEPTFLLGIESAIIEKIEILPFTKNLDSYYAAATALLDIDADIENDVFLSSKMSNYVMVNKTIISETGKNSPSRHLFKGIDSVIQCGHNADELCLAMEKAVEMKGIMKFDDRKSVIQMLQIENVIKELMKQLDYLVIGKSK
jgi:glycosyltransferase involved in cell wall biosynthesis